MGSITVDSTPKSPVDEQQEIKPISPEVISEPSQQSGSIDLSKTSGAEIAKILKGDDLIFEDKNKLIRAAVDYANPELLQQLAKITEDKTVNEDFRQTLTYNIGLKISKEAAGGRYDEIYQTLANRLNDAEESGYIRSTIAEEFAIRGMPEFVREQVGTALTDITLNRNISYPEDWDDSLIDGTRRYACKALGIDSLPVSENILTDSNESYDTKNDIVLALGEIGDIRAFDMLLAAVDAEISKDAKPKVVEAGLSDETSAEAAKEKEDSRNLYLANIVSAMYQLEPTESLDRLVSLCERSSGDFRNRLALLLTQVDGAAEQGVSAKLMADHTLPLWVHNEIIAGTSPANGPASLELIRSAALNELSNQDTSSHVATTKYLQHLIKQKDPAAGEFASQVLTGIVDKTVKNNSDEIEALTFAALKLSPQKDSRDLLESYFDPKITKPLYVKESLELLESFSPKKAIKQAEEILTNYPAESGSDWFRAKGAVEFLATHKPEVAADYLMQSVATTSSWPEKVEKMAILVELDPAGQLHRAVDFLKEGKVVEEPQLKRILTALSNSKEERAVNALEGLLNNGLALDKNVELGISGLLAEKGKTIGIERLVANIEQDTDFASQSLELLSKNPGEKFAGFVLEAVFDRHITESEAVRVTMNNIWSTADNKEAILASFNSWIDGKGTDRPDRPLIQNYINALGESIGQGIEFPFRLAPITLIDSATLRNADARGETVLSGEKDAVVVLPKSDHNGVLASIAQDLKPLSDNGYRVRVYEAGKDSEFAEILLASAARGGANLIVLGGHGDRNELALGGEDPAASAKQEDAVNLDLGDIEELKKLGAGAALKEDGKIALISCLVGSGEKEGKNLANGLRELFPQAVQDGIMAPVQSVSNELFTFTPNGEVDRIKYNVESYQAKNLELILPPWEPTLA